MAKLKSTAVKIFPSAFRGLATGTKYNPEARLNTEFNITNLINRLASKDSFVISWNPTSKVIIFNIHGYYFENNLTEFLGVGGGGASLTNIYASIKIRPFTTNDANTTYQAFTLVGTEDPSVTVQPSTGRILDIIDSGTAIFEGLDLHSTPITPAEGIYELHLLSGGPSSWAVPVTSVLKFKATDVEGLPTINNSITANTTSTIFAAATAGTAGQLSVSQGGVLAPIWISTADVVVGEASQAVQLKTSRNLWGRPFNGTAAISGAITGTGNITPTTNNVSNIGASDNVYANVFATTFTGNVTGNLTGDVTGTASGNLTSSSTLDASKLSGTILAAVAQAEWDAAYTHISTTNNPHSVTKAQVGLGSAENTTDASKPISTATQTALDAKQATITGGATTILSSNLTASRALVSDASGKVAVSAVTSTELGFIDGVTGNVQTQLNGKAATSHTHTLSAITNITATATELNYVDGVTSAIQTQLNGKAVKTPELMNATPITVNAGSTALISLTQNLSLSDNPKIKIYWKPTGAYGYFCSEFLLETISYQKFISASAQSYNVDNSRWEFYVLNFTPFSNPADANLVNRLTVSQGRRWFLDSSFSNEEDVSTFQFTVLSVTASAG